MYVSSGGHEEYLCVQAVGYNVYRCTNSRILYLEKSTTTMNKKKHILCFVYYCCNFHFICDPNNNIKIANERTGCEKLLLEYKY